jgi:hypothetical protein
MPNFRIKHLETEIRNVCNIFKTENGLSLSDMLNDLDREIKLFNENIKYVYIKENDKIVQSLYDRHGIAVRLDIRDILNKSTLVFASDYKIPTKFRIELKVVESISLVKDTIIIHLKEEAMEKFHNGEGYDQDIQLGDTYDEEIVDVQEIP